MQGNFVDYDALHIIMEFCDGGDLGWLVKAMRGQHIREQRVIRWVLQVFPAVRHLHQKNIVHRDLKTGNMLLANNRRVVKIGDFGIARVFGSPSRDAEASNGTPYYLSPEICDDKPCNSKTDI
jgi:NIMA (never in mitosis gene a)-related kinase